MEVITDVVSMQEVAEEARRAGKRIGFVPTMGALHEGHLSLIRKARPVCDLLVVSIYVNPTQFAVGEDLERYPRRLEEDTKTCQVEGVDIIFLPDDGSMYPDDFCTYVNVRGLSEILCGMSRPNHFQGVTTIVAKLFNIVKPHFAVFGQKDAQQAMIIKRMTADLNWDIDIEVAPTVREQDGLAMSSRNSYLSPEERKSAIPLYMALSTAKEMVLSGERRAQILKERMKEIISSHPLNRIDYIAVVEAKTLKDVLKLEGETLLALAVFVGKTRLIDNIIIGKGELVTGDRKDN